VSGTEVWRRAHIPETSTLDELHRLIQAGLDWHNINLYRFTCADSRQGRINPDSSVQVGELCDKGITELLYEYGASWTVKIFFHSRYQAGKDEVVRFVTGAGAAPPETIPGPLRFRRIMSALESGSGHEKQEALRELGPDFIPGLFDPEKCNRNLSAVHLVGK
jgi:hypothetical protein